MNIRNKIKQNHDDVLKGRFIQRVMTTAGEDILQAQTNEMRMQRFRTSGFFRYRNFKAMEEGLEINFATTHRFVDIKTRRLKSGKVIRKKSHSIYNRIIFGHLNNIIRELSFGFTDAIVEELKSMEN